MKRILSRMLDSVMIWMEWQHDAHHDGDTVYVFLSHSLQWRLLTTRKRRMNKVFLVLYVLFQTETVEDPMMFWGRVFVRESYQVTADQSVMSFENILSSVLIACAFWALHLVSMTCAMVSSSTVYRRILFLPRFIYFA